MTNTKTYFIKTVSNRIKEFIVCERDLHNNKSEIVLLTGFMDEDDAIVQGKTIVQDTTKEQLLNSIFSKLENFGYKTNYDQVVTSPFNTFKDGTNKPAVITKVINDVEKVKLPKFVQPTFNNQFHYNGTIRSKEGNEVNNPMLQELCSKVFDQINIPFDAVVTDTGIALIDVMLLNNTPFRNRLSIMKNVDVKGVTVVETTYVQDVPTLHDLYHTKIKEGFRGVSVIGANSLYIPSFNKTNSFLLQDASLIEGLVIGLEDDKVTVLDNNMQTHVVIKEEVDILEIVNIGMAC